MTYARNDLMSQAYREGAKAAFAHEWQEANPYERGTDYWKAWDLGYCIEAEAMARSCTTDA